jgi:hypothetical protein
MEDGKEENDVRFGDEERRLMHLVPAPAAKSLTCGTYFPPGS